MQLKAAVTDSERPCKAQLCAARPAACRDAGDFLLSSPGLSAGGLLSLPTTPQVWYFCLGKYNKEVKTAYSPGKYRKSVILTQP